MKSTRYADVPNGRNGFTHMGMVSENNKPILLPKVKSFWQNVKPIF